MATGDGKPPRQPRKPRADAVARRQSKPTDADRAKAARSIASVTPIREPRSRQRNHKNLPDSPERLQVADRRRKALQLRRHGMTFQAIADTLHTQGDVSDKYTRSDAQSDVKAMLDAVTVEAVHGYLEEDLAILLSLQRRVYPAAISGDLGATKVMLGILDRRSKYLGLDAPTKHQLTGADGGPINFAVDDPGDVYRAALDGLDALLPAPLPPMLPGAAGAET